MGLGVYICHGYPRQFLGSISAAASLNVCKPLYIREYGMSVKRMFTDILILQDSI